MESSSAPDSKRRRTSNTIQTITSITKLPHDQLSAIADFLSATSRILLSIALSSAETFTTNGMSEASKAIILSNQSGWEELDFSIYTDITDRELQQLLVLIDAKNTVKILRLNDCHKIIGHGLEPLRGSTVLERIYIDEEGGMCITTVIPIFESIIDSTENPRMDLVRDITSELATYVNRSPALVDFLLKLNQLLLNGHCDICVEENEPVERCELACLSCFKRHCGDCIMDNDDILKCDKCELMWCKECDEFAECAKCLSIFCSNCTWYEDVDAAFACGKYDCEEKYDGLNYPLCLGCRSKNSCSECLALHHPKLVAKNEKLSEENKQVKEENDQLREEVEELKLKLSWNYE